jgi:hypothetical protein
LNLVRMSFFTSLFFRLAMVFLDAARLVHERGGDPPSSSVQDRGSPANIGKQTRRALRHAMSLALREPKEF